MRTPVFQLQDLLAAFRKSKVLTKKELLAEVKCSEMTIWRLLSRHGYVTSYNKNARYYTITEIPQFDQYGLWAYRGVRFSKWGSLTKTVLALIQASDSGLNAVQLQDLLHVSSLKPLLSGLAKRGLVTREKVGGSFVYFGLTEKHRSKQLVRRHKALEQTKASRSLPQLDHIIALLVEIIRHPDGSPRKWIKRLTSRGVPLGTADVQAVLAHYNIDPKKGLLKS